MTAQNFCSEQNTLSIRLSTDGFSFSILDPLAEEKLTFFSHEVDPGVSLSANLLAAFREDERLQQTYRRVNVLVGGGRFTLLPLESFEDELAESVFHYNLTPKANEDVRYNVLQRNNVVVVFGVDHTAAAVITDRYPEAHFFAQSSPLIDFFAVKSRMGNCRKLYAFFSRDCMNVYAYDRGRLLMGNAYACDNTDDRVYFLLYAWKQLGFEQERDELCLSGLVLDKDRLLGVLRRYVRQVYVLPQAADVDLQAVEVCV